MIAAMMIPPPIAIPAMAPPPSCTLLEDLPIALLVEDGEPSPEELPPPDVTVDVAPSVLVAVPPGSLLKDVTDGPPI